MRTHPELALPAVRYLLDRLVASRDCWTPQDRARYEALAAQEVEMLNARLEARPAG